MQRLAAAAAAAALAVIVVAEVVVLGFTTLLTSLGISIVFYSEREKSDKFCSEALITAWSSFTCRKSTRRDPRLYFHSEGSHTQDIYDRKKIHRSQPGLNPRTSDPDGEYDKHGTIGVDIIIIIIIIIIITMNILLLLLLLLLLFCLFIYFV